VSADEAAQAGEGKRLPPQRVAPDIAAVAK
jgi:hypothetical protein